MKKIFAGTMLLFSLIICAQPGNIDMSFNINDGGFDYESGVNGVVRTTSIQSDGKIIIGGNFETKIARLNSNGYFDYSFNTGTGANDIVYTNAIQTDGKIIIGGDFTSYNGILINRIARLNTDGTLDNSFNTGTGTNNIIQTISIQSDGKIIIGGNFTSYNGISRNRIARLNTDGTLDTSFNPGTGADSNVYTNSIQSDGKIIIGGAFSSVNGILRNRIARINTNGTLDTSFNPGSGVSGASAVIRTTKISTDGKIYIGGNFTSYNGYAISGLVRLFTNGTRDVLFDPGSVFGSNSGIYSISIKSNGTIIVGGNFAYGFGGGGVNRFNTISFIPTNPAFDSGYGVGDFTPCILQGDSVYSTSIQSDGKIIIGGDFVTWWGSCFINDNIIRVSSSSIEIIDDSFYTQNAANGYVNCSSIQSDGKIIIGGDFTLYNGTSLNRITRLNTNGNLDSSFNTGTGANGSVFAISKQTNGKIIIGGNFTSYNDISKNRITRLNTDGTQDNSFNTGTGANDIISTISIQSDGKIIIGGNFTSYNGISRSRIARLNTDGTLDTSFDVGTGNLYSVKTSSIQADGKIIIGGDFNFNNYTQCGIARLNTNGTLDTSFTACTGGIHCMSIQTDGKIIIGGTFTDINDISINRVARLNTNGTLDNSFNPGTGANILLNIYPQTMIAKVLTISIQTDGKIIIGGTFTSYNGFAIDRIARLNANGTIDSSFTPGEVNNTVCTTSIQTDGKIIIGGEFSIYNGSGRHGIVRINGDSILNAVDFEKNNIVIYPNPSKGIFNINYNGLDVKHIDIYTLLGQKIFSKDITTETSIDISGQTQGIYIYKLSGSNAEVKTGKIILE